MTSSWGRTLPDPHGGQYSMTPMHGAGSRTPMYGSQTPMHDGELGSMALIVVFLRG